MAADGCGAIVRAVPGGSESPPAANASRRAAVVGAVNQGDDADTTGALVGMLAGARFGAQALPRRWLNKLDHQTRLLITEQTAGLLALALAP